MFLLGENKLEHGLNLHVKFSSNVKLKLKLTSNQIIYIGSLD